MLITALMMGAALEREVISCTKDLSIFSASMGNSLK